MKLIKIKHLLMIISALILFSLTGCGESNVNVNVNVENSEELNNIVLGKDALIEIGSCLWYDQATRIVYW